MVKGCPICSYESAATPMYQTAHWTADLAPEQGYLGHTYLYLRRHAASLSELTPVEWAELRVFIQRFELAVSWAFDAQVFNWVCLMNNAFKDPNPDPHVHWKVRPRYSEPVTVGGVKFADPNFAHHYDKSRDNDHLAAAGTSLRGEIEAAIKEYM